MSFIRKQWLVLACFAVAGLALAATLALLVPGSGSNGRPDLGGPFRLTAQTGEMVDSDQLKGKPFAVFFGFTHCPEMCPTTMAEMSELLKDLGNAPGARDLKVFFVSVDPARDTLELLRDYLSNFAPRILGLTGTEAEIAAITKEYRAYYAKVPTKDDEYTMNHTALVYLMGPQAGPSFAVDQPGRS